MKKKKKKKEKQLYLFCLMIIDVLFTVATSNMGEGGWVGGGSVVVGGFVFTVLASKFVNKSLDNDHISNLKGGAGDNANRIINILNSSNNTKEKNITLIISG